MRNEPGLRELKKQRTRDEIADTADRLFAERGFDAVTVSDIARDAQVAVKTVFNYFPTKEDLFFSRGETFGDELIDAVRNRAAGETVLAAFRSFVMKPRGALALDAGESRERVNARLHVLLESPPLLAREKLALANYSMMLADLIAEDTAAGPADIEPRIAADALLSVHAALIDYVRPRIVVGESREELLRAFRRQGRRAFARLEVGLGDYARRASEVG